MLFVALTTACQIERPREHQLLAGVTDSTLVVHEVVDSRSLCSSCIRLEEVVAIGDEDGPGYLMSNTLGYRLRDGNYWVGEAGAIKLFDPKGQFLRQVGREGEGPMEFGFPNPIYQDSAGNIHVVDLNIPRITIVKPDFTLERTIALPQLAPNVAALPGGQYVANMSIGMPDGIAQPLHVLDESGQILHSFGAPGGGTSSTAGLAARRVMATDGADWIVAARQTRYLIEVWTASGRRIVGYRGPELNPYDERPPGLPTPDNPPDSRINDIYLDEAERLWVASFRVRDEWHERSDEIALPDGRTMLQPKNDDQSSWVVGRIEIIDLNRGEIVARRDFEEQVMTFLGEGLVIGPRQTLESVPQLGVWQLTYDGEGFR